MRARLASRFVVSLSRNTRETYQPSIRELSTRYPLLLSRLVTSNFYFKLSIPKLSIRGLRAGLSFLTSSVPRFMHQLQMCFRLGQKSKLWIWMY